MITPEQRARYIWKTLCGNGYADDITLSSIADEIKAAIAEAAPRWIPAAERLPDVGFEAMVISGNGSLWFAIYKEGLWWVDYDDGSDDVIDGVTHWHPLPIRPTD